MALIQNLPRIILIGIGATLIMDLWLMLLSRLGVPSLNFGLVGRWIGHLCLGRLTHGSIAAAKQIPGEKALGWTVHYAIGVAFALLLVGLAGEAWLHNPSIAPAIAIGVGTVAFPFLVMQPAMGSGFAAAKTATPGRNRFKSVASHAVFGAGLYLSAAFLAWACLSAA